MANLDTVLVRRSARTNRIHLARRTSKEPNLVEFKRDVTGEVLEALVSFAFKGKMPEPGERTTVAFGSDDKQYLMAIIRKPAEESVDG